jgi:carbonic anhydrase
VIRVAGNVLNDVNIGSIEYAAEHAGVPLVVVLGHKRCGAVTAAVEGGHAAGHIENIVEAILPAVEEAKKRKGKNIVEEAAHINVERAVKTLTTSDPILSHLVKEGKLTVIGAYYDLDTGKVELQ